MILCGQPILRERLAEPRHYALAQRVGVRIRLRPLTEAEVGLFVVLHLKAAKRISDLPIFLDSPMAIDAGDISRASPISLAESPS